MPSLIAIMLPIMVCVSIHRAPDSGAFQGFRFTVAISSRRMRRLANARYSCARLGSLKRVLLWAFEFLRPTTPLKRNRMPFCSSRSASLWRLLN